MPLPQPDPNSKRSREGTSPTAAQRQARGEATTKSFVKEIRLQRGLSQIQLAGLVETTLPTIRCAERGLVIHMRTGLILRIASALDVSPADLFPVLGKRK